MSQVERAIQRGPRIAVVRPEDLVVAAICLVIAAVTAVQSYPNYVGRNNTLGSGAYPFWLAVVLTLCGLVQAWRAVRLGLAPKETWPMGRGRLRLLLAMGCLILYLFILDTVGFWISSSLVLLFYFRVLGNYSWRVAVPVAFLSAFAVAYIFGVLLFLPLPRGIVGL